MKLVASFVFGAAFAAILAACSASGGEETFAPQFPDEDAGTVKSSDSNGSSGSVAPESSDSAVEDSAWAALVEWAEIPATDVTRGTATYSISGFEIATTEVTRDAYTKVMGSVPQQANDGEDFPVENVNWYEAVLFCNAYSKLLGRDTAYVYTFVGDESYLKDLTIDYAVKGAIRLPTENEWEVAARGGTTSTYYWGTDEAKKYAYYAQSKGPVEVAGYLPNAYGLYDMGGNVAEWTNDWYAAYPTTAQENYTGANSGDYKVVRGGGWPDKAPALASAERDKEDPKYRSQKVGFRVVYSEGF